MRIPFAVSVFDNQRAIERALGVVQEYSNVNEHNVLKTECGVTVGCWTVLAQTACCENFADGLRASRRRLCLGCLLLHALNCVLQEFCIILRAFATCIKLD